MTTRAVTTIYLIISLIYDDILLKDGKSRKLFKRKKTTNVSVAVLYIIQLNKYRTIFIVIINIYFYNTSMKTGKCARMYCCIYNNIRIYVYIYIYKYFIIIYAILRAYLREIARSKIGVLRFLVPAEVDLSLESSAAQVARERFVSRVLTTVRDQIRRLAKGFSANLTLVRFFTCKPTIRNVHVMLGCTTHCSCRSESKRVLWDR